MEITFSGGKVVTAKLGGHTIITDQPLDNGGGNTAPAPFDLYLASIGTCAGIYVKSFCDKRGIPAEDIKIIQKVEFDPEKRVPSKINLDIQVPPSFPEKYRESLISVAELCAVKKSIMNPPEFSIETSLIQEETLFNISPE
ncbi:MAG TPA: OsmC family protein [Bacteroidales bacterium]|nr:OsmC family protein [Bacteroidales bacterium]HPF02393.1 OsmC family protein [Bacteroidales bacterium]HPJ58924.1 OsmC family protein [Bacteroidales bacterium]HPR12178.1 OsmC family protein [Bacteroidales bacterium]HRW84861.1 OsmC family protein [Bacteroidales bacterium]